MRDRQRTDASDATLSIEVTPTPKPPYQRDSSGYAYYRASDAGQEVRHQREARELSQKLLFPGWRDPNFLVLRERRKIFSDFAKSLPAHGLAVLDIGGRLQPLRSLIEDRLGNYIAIDPVLEGLLDVVAVGEAVPFRDATFDLVICTQVLTYATEPQRVISECHRVLKPGGALFLSVPAIFPRYFDIRWCFMPDGLLGLLSSFSRSEIFPEDHSIAGLLRSFNLFLDTFIRSETLRKLTSCTVYPLMNLAGLSLDRFSGGRTEFTTNYSCIARK